MVEFLLKPWQKREEVLHGDGRVVTTVAIRCSFHVFVAYRVYSPIRFAVSMGTRGKTYRFSLSTPLKENSFEYPLATFRFSHLLRILFRLLFPAGATALPSSTGSAFTLWRWSPEKKKNGRVGAKGRRRQKGARQCR